MAASKDVEKSEWQRDLVQRMAQDVAQSVADLGAGKDLQDKIAIGSQVLSFALDEVKKVMSAKAGQGQFYGALFEKFTQDKGNATKSKEVKAQENQQHVDNSAKPTKPKR